MAEEKDETQGGKDDAKTDDAKSPKRDDKGGTSSDDGGKGDAKSDEKSMESVIEAKVNEAVEKIKAALVGSGGVTPRRADIEEQAKRMVEEAAAKLQAEKEHEADHANLKKEAKEAVEDAPKKVRKLTKLFWGEAE